MYVGKCIMYDTADAETARYTGTLTDGCRMCWSDTD